MVPGHAKHSDEEGCVWDPHIPLQGPLGIVTVKKARPPQWPWTPPDTI